MRSIEQILACPLVHNLQQYGRIDILEYWRGAIDQFTPDQLQVNLHQTWQLPNKINALVLDRVTVRLSLVWWADLAEVWVNGQQVRVGDLFDQKCCLLLGEQLNPGARFELEIKLWKPKHDCLGFTHAQILVEYPHQACDPGRLATEIEIVAMFLPILIKENAGLVDIFQDFVEKLTNFGTDSFELSDLGSLATIRSHLFVFSEYLKRRKIYILGNSHIDIAWLWPIAETKQVIERTFQSTLALQKNYPELIFNHSSALTYEWIEKQHPELFSQIQQAIASGKWEPIGGMWVEPDGNLPSGESLIRQIFYGKTYFLEKLNQDSQIAWLPDTFGFNYQLPQILAKSGFTAFITQKLSWNDTHKFPYSLFWWRGLDGSKILTYFCNQLGMGIEPVAIAQYLANQSPQVDQALWLYGVGDHGGGVTQEMLDLARAWQRSPLFFELVPSTAADFVQHISQVEIDLPIWTDELYLEFHRGTYTSKADQKWQNRQAEMLLTSLEKLYAIATISNFSIYPHAQLDRAWQLLLTNQFHDILPGTAIPEVFADADRGWEEIRQIGQALLEPWQENLHPEQFYLCNLLNWPRQGLIELPKSTFATDINWSAYRAVFYGGQFLSPIQETEDSILFYGGSLPSFSVREVRFQQSITPGVSGLKVAETEEQDFSLENQYLKICISGKTGEITEIYDRRYQTQILSGAIKFQFFQDQGQYWDAWNIDPSYAQHLLESTTLASIRIKESGDLRLNLEVSSRFRSSKIVQQFQLDAYSGDFTCKVQIDWQEQHILSKIHFPLSFTADFATYEIPMGAIARSTQDPAKFEAPAQFWADLSGAGIGLAVVNDCKYGYSATPNSLSLTALRSPQWPCPDSDRGFHQFCYRLIPHQGNWQAAEIVRAGHEFNTPLLAISRNEHFPIPSVISISPPNIVVSAFKRSRDHLWVLRCYEAVGKAVDTKFELGVAITRLVSLDLLERVLESLEHQSQSFVVNFQPFEIKTFGLELAK